MSLPLFTPTPYFPSNSKQAIKHLSEIVNPLSNSTTKLSKFQFNCPQLPTVACNQLTAAKWAYCYPAITFIQNSLSISTHCYCTHSRHCFIGGPNNRSVVEFVAAKCTFEAQQYLANQHFTLVACYVSFYSNFLLWVSIYTCITDVLTLFEWHGFTRNWIVYLCIGNWPSRRQSINAN